VALYRDVILAEPALAAYWPCNDAGPTTVADAAPVPVDGTGVNTPTFGVAGPLVINTPGDKAITLNPVSTEEITIPDAAKLDMSTGLTMEAWLKPNSNPGPGIFRTVFTKLAAALTNGDYDFSYTNTAGVAQINVEIQTGAGAFVPKFNLAGFLSTTSWSHIGCTWDGSNIRCYRDGVIQGSPSAATGTMAATTNSARIGRYGTGTDYWDGSVGHVAIYNQALSAAALLNHFTVATSPPDVATVPHRMPLGV
jgi:hypothetical protein